MNFIERFVRRGSESEVSSPHRDFSIRAGQWYFNRELSMVDAGVDVKVRFAFDDPALLDGCRFYAKIGINEDSKLSHKYIGFAYCRSEIKDALTGWVKKFPYAEVIDKLDRDGIATPESSVVIISGTN